MLMGGWQGWQRTKLRDAGRTGFNLNQASTTVPFVLPLTTLQFRMDPMLLEASRFVALLVGLLAYYIAVFMYEDEEGKWQNRIEKLWVDINDREKQAGTKASAFFSKVAAITTKVFNSIFGPRLLSARFVGTSICWSLATMLLFALLALQAKRLLGRLDLSPTDLASFWHAELVVLITGLLFSFLAILPSLWHSRWAVALSLLPVIFFFFGFLLVLLVRTHSLKPENWGLILGLALSLLSDVLLVGLVRFTVRWVSAKASVSRTALAILIQLSIVYFLVLVPFAIPVGFPDFSQSVGLMALLMMGGLNIFTALASLTFVLSLLLLLPLLLLHRALWPVLGRIIYPLDRHQIIRNRKITVPLGSACIIYALPLMPTPIKTILQWWLAK